MELTEVRAASALSARNFALRLAANQKISHATKLLSCTLFCPLPILLVGFVRDFVSFNTIRRAKTLRVLSLFCPTLLVISCSQPDAALDDANSSGANLAFRGQSDADVFQAKRGRQNSDLARINVASAAPKNDRFGNDGEVGEDGEETTSTQSPDEGVDLELLLQDSQERIAVAEAALAEMAVDDNRLAELESEIAEQEAVVQAAVERSIGDIDLGSALENHGVSRARPRMLESIAAPPRALEIPGQEPANCPV
jgi:hypothetical protein